MSDNPNQIELILPVTDGINAPTRVWADRQEIALRGSRTAVGRMLAQALAAYADDRVIAELDADQIVTAVRTLGQVIAAGLDIREYDDTVTDDQVNIGDHVSGLWATDYHQEWDTDETSAG